MTPQKTDVLVLGAGAAGLFCAIEAGRRGRQVIVLDHARKPAEKIRISGGGRCNFTNLHASAENFISANPHFCKSALKQFTQFDFLDRVEARGIQWFEKTLGQLFCENSAKDIIQMLLDDCAAAGVDIQLNTKVSAIRREGETFTVQAGDKGIECQSLVVATGGLSIPKMGATGFAYDVARQFGVNVTPTRAGLVPFTFNGATLEPIKALAGVSVDGRAATQTASFDEAILFTHRGLSGPAILQASSYWTEGEDVIIDLARETDLFERLKSARLDAPKKTLANVLTDVLPSRLAQTVAGDTFDGARMADLSNDKLQTVADRVKSWRIRPDGTEGYRTAEVTLGGVDVDELSSRTMEVRSVSGLYFVGEAVDVTGWLGGFNFQWAWSSGWVAGQNA